jgi:hypothetical protein
VIMNRLWKDEDIQDQVLSKIVLADPLYKGWPSSAFREHTVNMGFMVEPMIFGY